MEWIKHKERCPVRLKFCIVNGSGSSMHMECIADSVKCETAFVCIFVCVVSQPRFLD